MKIQVDVMAGHQVMTAYVAGHVRTKSADFAICRTMVRVLASQRMSIEYAFHESLLVFMDV